MLDMFLPVFISEKNRGNGYERLEDVLDREYIFFSEKQVMKRTLILGSDYEQGKLFTEPDVSGYSGHLTKWWTIKRTTKEIYA